jgi:hypothetical protein
VHYKLAFYISSSPTTMILILLEASPMGPGCNISEATGRRVTITPKWDISMILLIFDLVGLYM